VTNVETIWIIAGESSGDTYGANLARELQLVHPQLKVRGMGGPEMQAAGVDCIVDSTDLGIVGFVEVIKHLPAFVGIFRQLVNRAAQERPAAVVLIDYPGFNLRFAEKIHKLGIPVIYYVSPQVWAWGRRRIPKMARIIDKMLVLFPFETDVFKGTGLDVEFVGHPLLEALAPIRRQAGERDPNLVLLLPGSRLSEVKRLIHPMLDTAAAIKGKRPETHFVIPAPGQKQRDYIHSEWERHAGRMNWPAVKLVPESARQWMAKADAGIAASGTVTIEAAILGLPLVVVYRLHWLTYHFARLLVDIPYFTMANLVLKEELFQEFLQKDVHPELLTPALEAICSGGTRRPLVEDGIVRLREALGSHTDISHNTARKVLKAAGLE